MFSPSKSKFPNYKNSYRIDNFVVCVYKENKNARNDEKHCYGQKNKYVHLRMIRNELRKAEPLPKWMLLDFS